MNEDISIEKQLFLVQEMIKESNNAITIADAKAGFSILLSGTILGIFFTFIDDLFVFLNEQTIAIKVIIIVLILSSALSIFLSIVVSILSVTPRYGSLEEGEKPKLPYFLYVSRKIESSKKLLDKVKEQKNEDILEIMTTQSYELTKIADKKVAHVRCALLLFLSSLFSVIGLVVLGIFYFKRLKFLKKKKNS